MRKFFTPKKIIILLVIISFIYLSFFYYLKKNQQSDNNGVVDLSKVTVSYEGLQLGKSSEEDIKEKLGTPIKEKEEDGKKIFEYESKNPNFNNEITVSSGRIYFVKQVVVPEENITIDSLKNKYGTPKNILYGQESVNGYYLYLYSEKGVAFLGNQNLNEVLEIWYFSPTTYSEFKDLFAKEYSEDKNHEIQ